MKALEGVAEALFLLAIVASPWHYGAADDVARFALCALLLTAGALAALARGVSGDGLPRLALPAASLPAFALLQMALGRSAAPVWTAEAVVVSSAVLSALVFWSERARERPAALRLAVAVLATCVAQAAFGAMQWQAAPNRIYGITTPFVTMPFGSFVNHNHFAGLVGMAALLALGMAAGHARRARHLTPASLVLFGISLALLAAHVASRSRGGLLALAGGLVVLFVLAAPRSVGSTQRRLGFAAAGAVVLLAVALFAVSSGARRHLGTIAQAVTEGSARYRMDVARDTLRLFGSAPLLGSGLGAYADAFPAFKQGHGDVRTTHAENDVLEFLAEGGVAGVALLAWLGWGLVAAARRALRREPSPFRRGITTGALAGVAALLFHSFLDFNLRIPSNALVFASLLGLAAAGPTEAEVVGRRRLPLVLAALLAVLASASAWRARGTWELAQVAPDATASARVEALGSLLARHPYLAEAHHARGLAWRELASAPGGWRLDRLGRAETQLESALDLRPRWGVVIADLGWTRALAGRVAEAENDLRKAVTLDPGHVAIGLAQAEFLAARGRVGEAVEALERVRRASGYWPAQAARSVAEKWSKDPALLGRIGRFEPAR